MVILRMATLEVSACIFDIATFSNLISVPKASWSALCSVFVCPALSSIRSTMALRAAATFSRNFSGSISDKARSQRCRHLGSVISSAMALW